MLGDERPVLDRRTAQGVGASKEIPDEGGGTFGFRVEVDGANASVTIPDMGTFTGTLVGSGK